MTDFLSMNASLAHEPDWREHWKGFFKEKSEHNRVKAKERAVEILQKKKTTHIVNSVKWQYIRDKRLEIDAHY